MSTVVEQTMEVLVRIKPLSQDQEDEHRCIALSDCEEHTIVVESHSKKQLFSFDYIAAQDCTQLQLYQRLGAPVLQDCLTGYNSCVFSYGQTGAGKTYSMLGQTSDLIDNPLCESRGILPRLVEEMFQKIQNSKKQFCKVNIQCSYLEIYNQQVIDLLSKECRSLFVRQDIRRGVYVDGLTELSISSYEDALSIITRGLMVRKTSSTFMNPESSRSHTIFTILLNIESSVDDIRKTIKSKLHLVDLAGSERIKLTKVQGERLKEGCNINKSLLTLSHVISSLAQAGKKKKHIPFRDSKLTFFLKDSLGGNSKTKLLANVSPKSMYIGDTISTLMFAKRVKIIKSISKLNQNFADNFQSLRTEIRQLRQELAQTKFIQSLSSEFKSQRANFLLDKSTILSREAVLPTQSFLQCGSVQNNQSLRIFEENETSYRAIVDHCLQMLRQHKNSKQAQTTFKKIFQQKKSLQKVVAQQQKLIRNFPRFTQIFKQNIECRKKIVLLEEKLEAHKEDTNNKTNQISSLNNNIQLLTVEIQELTSKYSQLQKSKQQDIVKQETSKLYDKIIKSGKKDQISYKTYSCHRSSKSIPELQFGQIMVRRSSLMLTKRTGFRDIVERQNDMIDEYQQTIDDIRKKFAQTMFEMKAQYMLLEEMYLEEKRQKYEICKRKKKQPEIETLMNENQYLKLKIMDLESEIMQLEGNLFKREIEIKTNKQEQHRLSVKIQRMQSIELEDRMKEHELLNLIDKIQQIKFEAEKANKLLNQDIQKQEQAKAELEKRIAKLTRDNLEMVQNQKILLHQTNKIKQHLMQISPNCKIEQIYELEFGKKLLNQKKQCSEKNFSQQIQKLLLDKQFLEIQKQNYERQSLQYKTLLEKASYKILNLSKDISIFKESSATFEQQIAFLMGKSELLEKQNSQLVFENKMLQINCSRQSRQNEKQSQLISSICVQLSQQSTECLVQDIIFLKNLNKVISKQNQQLKIEADQIKKKAVNIKNIKSTNNLCFKEIKDELAKGQSENSQRNGKYNRQLISQLRSKDKQKGKEKEMERQKQSETTKKCFFLSSFHLQRQRSTAITPKPLTEEVTNKIRKLSNNK